MAKKSTRKSSKSAPKRAARKSSKSTRKRTVRGKSPKAKAAIGKPDPEVPAPLERLAPPDVFKFGPKKRPRGPGKFTRDQHAAIERSMHRLGQLLGGRGPEAQDEYLVWLGMHYPGLYIGYAKKAVPQRVEQTEDEREHEKALQSNWVEERRAARQARLAAAAAAAEAEDD